MRKACGLYRSEEISRFVDNELSQDRQAKIEEHLSHCQECRALAESFTSLSGIFSEHTRQQAARINPDQMRRQLQSRIRQQNAGKKGVIFGFSAKPLYLKVASAALILMISILTVQNAFFSPTGPSAIVKSVDTDFASVMIIETQKEKHTIIWFTET